MVSGDFNGPPVNKLGNRCSAEWVCHWCAFAFSHILNMPQPFTAPSSKTLSGSHMTRLKNECWQLIILTVLQDEKFVVGVKGFPARLFLEVGPGEEIILHRKSVKLLLWSVLWCSFQ